MENAVIAKQHGDIVTHSINYNAGSDCHPIVAGMHLTGGVPATINGMDVVRFEQKVEGRTVIVKYDTRPDLAALVAEYREIENAKRAAREQKWAEAKAKQDAIDQPLLDAMYAEAIILRKQIPSDHVEVVVVQTGSLDGHPILEYTADGVKLNWQDVNIIGVASAIRPGAIEAFGSIRVTSINKKMLERIKSAQSKNAAEKAAAQAAWQKEITETEIPQAALEAYNCYKGSSEAAWEQEDEAAWALIEKWAPYIEAQHGVHNAKLRRIARDVTRESGYGISD